MEETPNANLDIEDFTLDFFDNFGVVSDPGI